MAMKIVHLGLDSIGYSRQCRPDNDGLAFASVKKARRNCDVDSGACKEAATAIEHTAQFGNSISQARQLAVCRIENAVNNKERKSDETEVFAIKKSAAGKTNEHAQDGELDGRYVKYGCCRSHDKT